MLKKLLLLCIVVAAASSFYFIPGVTFVCYVWNLTICNPKTSWNFCLCRLEYFEVEFIFCKQVRFSLGYIFVNGSNRSGSGQPENLGQIYKQVKQVRFRST